MRTALATALLLLAAPPAFAQAVLHEEAQTEEAYRSPQHWAVELRFGPYTPDVDSELKGTATPHKTFFGDKHRLLFQVEGDYEFFRSFGTLAATVSAGFFRESANAFVQGTDAMERSGDTTSLTLYPLGIGLAYRFDVLTRRLGIPLVPYAKAGLTYTLWSITDGNGDVAKFSDAMGGKGRGGTAGWSAGAGLAFVLNFLDPTASRAFDAESGVNRTYLFLEFDHLDSSGLGRKNVLHVGDDTWCGGLMFEF